MVPLSSSVDTSFDTNSPFSRKRREGVGTTSLQLLEYYGGENHPQLNKSTDDWMHTLEVLDRENDGEMKSEGGEKGNEGVWLLGFMVGCREVERWSWA